MHNFRNLNVWKKSKQLVKEIYSTTSKFPNNEDFVLSSQMRRAVISISSNIAEGSGRSGKKDFLKFLDMALGSAFELESQLEISIDLRYLDRNTFKELKLKIQEVQSMIIGKNAYHRKGIQEQ